MNSAMAKELSSEKKQANEVSPLVSNQRELLIAFLKWRRGEILGDYTITEIDTFLEEQSEK